MSDSATPTPQDTPPTHVLRALLAQSLELVAVSDRDGRIEWVNARFVAATGVSADGVATVAALALDGSDGDIVRRRVASALEHGALDAEAMQVRAADGAALWVEARVGVLGALLLWTLTDVTSTRFLATQARRQGELLDAAQEFGRLGLWERKIPSGEGRWDAHIFRFWGLDPAAGPPSIEAALQRVHPDDRPHIHLDAMQRAGRYAQRFRVVHADGRTRWIHSQWEVKNGPNGAPDRAIGVMMDDTEVFDAAHALGDVNAQLKMAVDLGKIAIWRHDLRTRRFYYSDRAFELLQMEPRPEGLTLDDVRAMIHPEDIPLVKAAAEEALHSDQPTDMEARYRRADGTYRYVMTRRVVERDEQGEPIAFVGVALDISDRVEQRRQADAIARRLEAASQAAGLGLWATTDDPPEVDWNAQMFVLFDRFTFPVAPTFSQWLHEAVHPDDRQRVAATSYPYLKHGDGPFELEFRVLRRDGSVRWVVMRADRDRAVVDRRRHIGVAIDVTEHHAALDALRDAGERVSLITRYAGIGTWEAHFDGSPEMWDEQMFQLRGLAPRDRAPTREERLALVHPDDGAHLLDAAVDVPDHGQPTAYEFRVRLPDGSYRWMASRSLVLRDESGRATRRVGVNWDVTEARQAEQVRQQAALAEREVQAKSQFLSRMSHELRTPLNAVLGFTQLLQIEARRASNGSQLAKLGHIRSAGDHLLSLINDVLDLSGLESGDMKLTSQAVELGPLIRQSMPLVEPLAAQHGVLLDIGPLDGVANGDPTRLRQVLINLLTNAIKYNRRGGRVVTQARANGASVVFSVRDTGRGLDARQLAGLFEPFNRFGAESEGIEGTGIGLTIVKALVTGMGGSIAVTSTPGAGTVFEVTLPAAPGDAPPPVPPMAETVDASMHEPMPPRPGQLLYIEDNQVNVLLVEELVRSVGGLSITSEVTGASGVARAVALRPELVLVDLQLPDFDGFEVLRRLRADPATRDIPCIALSANALPEDIERGLAAGFVDYWTKPIDFSAFLAALRKRFPAAAPARTPQAVASSTSPLPLSIGCGVGALPRNDA